MCLAMLAGCSVNPATGQRQFTALMSPQQEIRTGATEHQKVMQTYGAKYDGTPLQAYVNEVGQRVVKNTERTDVQYKFYVLDTPMVNAFAIPGGYIYVTRGLLALANSEDELASVLAHETGHITGRHSAERYSRGILTSLGAAALSVALDSADATQAIGLGTELYTKQYSRGQEEEADRLGVRYLAQAGYDPGAMARFLHDMDRYATLEDRLAGRSGSETFDFFSTHPQTAGRVSAATAEAGKYPAAAQPAAQDVNYLARISGLVYGDNPEQGFVRGQDFYHPGLGIAFSVPAGFTLSNQPDKVVASGPDGTVMVFDGAANPDGLNAQTYLAREWLKGEQTGPVQSLTIDGKPAASILFGSPLNRAPMDIWLTAIQWGADRFYRFQIGLPQKASPALRDSLQKSMASLHVMTDAERNAVQPYRIETVTAAAGDTVQTLTARMAAVPAKLERFRALNGLDETAEITPGRIYKFIAE